MEDGYRIRQFIQRVSCDNAASVIARKDYYIHEKGGVSYASGSVHQDRRHHPAPWPQIHMGGSPRLVLFCYGLAAGVGASAWGWREMRYWGTIMVMSGALLLCGSYPSLAADTVTSSTVSSSTVVDKTPPTANSPSIVINNNDICQVGASAAIQLPGIGLSAGATRGEENCELIKLARSVFGMGLKVAGIALLCTDHRVWDGLWMAGSPCPYLGEIGDEAKKLWLANPDRAPAGSMIRVATPAKPHPGRTTFKQRSNK